MSITEEIKAVGTKTVTTTLAEALKAIVDDLLALGLYDLFRGRKREATVVGEARKLKAEGKPEEAKEALRAGFAGIGLADEAIILQALALAVRFLREQDNAAAAAALINFLASLPEPNRRRFRLTLSDIPEEKRAPILLQIAIAANDADRFAVLRACGVTHEPNTAEQVARGIVGALASSVRKAQAGHKSKAEELRRRFAAPTTPAGPRP